MTALARLRALWRALTLMLLWMDGDSEEDKRLVARTGRKEG